MTRELHNTLQMNSPCVLLATALLLRNCVHTSDKGYKIRGSFCFNLAWPFVIVTISGCAGQLLLICLELEQQRHLGQQHLLLDQLDLVFLAGHDDLIQRGSMDLFFSQRLFGPIRQLPQSLRAAASVPFSAAAPSLVSQFSQRLSHSTQSPSLLSIHVFFILHQSINISLIYTPSSSHICPVESCDRVP